MDWMYQNGLAAQQDAAKRADEHLLGKPAALAQQQQQAAQELSKVSHRGQWQCQSVMGSVQAPLCLQRSSVGSCKPFLLSSDAYPVHLAHAAVRAGNQAAVIHDFRHTCLPERGMGAFKQRPAAAGTLWDL